MAARLNGTRYLHLLANFKWTGPSDPAIRCARDLHRAGCDVRFAQAAWTLAGAEHRMSRELWNEKLPVTGDLELRKHFHLTSHLRDARRLRARIDRGDFAVLHSHLLADHLIAAWAKRTAARDVLLVRSLYEPEAPRRSWRNRLAFRYTDGVVVPTRVAVGQVCSRFGFDRDRVLYQDPPTDPWRRRSSGDLRDRLELDTGDFAVGLTARVQPHRRFDLLWEVARRVVDRVPNARFVLLGRGNAEDTERLVRAPIRRLGLERAVRTPGYLYEPDYSAALRSLDAFLFLVPGSDGTCRAVREVMALGVPIVGTRRGILPELLGAHPELPEFGPSGIACDETVDALGDALSRLAGDPDARRRLGAAGRARADGPMNPTAATERLLEFYAHLRARSRRPLP